MSALLAILAGVSIVASVPLVARVKLEYERDSVLSPATVIAVWVVYVVIAAVAIAAAITGTWDLGIERAVALPAGLALAAAGLALVAWGLVSMASLRRMSGMMPDELIIEGAFRYSRNPQNVGLVATMLGAGIAGSSGLTLAIAIAFSVVLRIYLVYEEHHLERLFGDRYVRYKARTSRVLGLAGTRVPHG